jgi:hypothetical protein
VAYCSDYGEPDRLGVGCAAGARAADPPAAPHTRVAGDAGGTLGGTAWELGADCGGEVGGELFVSSRAALLLA